MRALLLTVLLVAFGTVWGGGEPWRQNTRFLPSYCKDRVKGTTHAAWTKWRRVFRDVHIHMHHYCAGVYSEMQAKTVMNDRARKGHLNVVVDQMRYVGNACKVDCVLYPELHQRWGWALGEQGKISEAVRHYKLSIKAKPDYARAYAGLSDLYVEIGQPEEAAAILEEGLQAAPNSKQLKRKLKKLNEAN